MAKSFASVEWLSQSSRKEDNTKTSLTLKDQQTTCNTWSPVMRSIPRIAHVAPYPGTQRLTSPGNNHASPYLWDIEESTKDKVQSYALDNQRASPSNQFSQGDIQASCSPVYNGQYNTSGNFVISSQDSNVSQDVPSSSQESYESQEQRSFTEDFSHSSCSPNTESGYDSETSCSRTTTPISSGAEESSDTSDEEGKVGRRLRTAFTSEQITTLENTFQKHKYLGASERRKLAAKLQLSEVQIKTWFQNRRMKHKREMQEGRQMPFHPAQFYSMYGYSAQPVSPYQYTHSGQQLHVQNSLVDPMSYNYSSPPAAFDSMNSFSPQPVPVMYLPQQPLMPPAVYHEEQQFARLAYKTAVFSFENFD